jgi:uncharacterized protein
MPSKAEFRIPVSELDAAGKDYHFVLRPSWVRGALEDHEATASTEDGSLDVRVSKSGTDVVVHGTLVADLEAECARCLKPVKVHVHGPLSVLFVPEKALKAPGKDEYEMSPEEADTIPFDGDTVVLDDVVRDELVLETPMIPLCSEDCPGISPPPLGGADEATTGGDKPLDPRLAPLLRLKKMSKE